MYDRAAVHPYQRHLIQFMVGKFQGKPLPQNRKNFINPHFQDKDSGVTDEGDFHATSNRKGPFDVPIRTVQWLDAHASLGCIHTNRVESSPIQSTQTLESRGVHTD